jgi:uncharacterized protein (TIGR02246 family)
MERTLLEELLAERAITRLIHQFIRLNDAGDYEALAALFTPDGRFTRPTTPDQPIIGREAILASFKARPPRLTRHLAANIEIDLLADGQTAQARSQIILFTSPVAGGPVSLLVGGFDDELVRQGDGWLFRSRQGSLLMKGGLQDAP